MHQLCRNVEFWDAVPEKNVDMSHTYGNGSLEPKATHGGLLQKLKWYPKSAMGYFWPETCFVCWSKCVFYINGLSTLLDKIHSQHIVIIVIAHVQILWYAIIWKEHKYTKEHVVNGGAFIFQHWKPANGRRTGIFIAALFWKYTTTVYAFMLYDTSYFRDIQKNLDGPMSLWWGVNFSPIVF